MCEEFDFDLCSVVEESADYFNNVIDELSTKQLAQNILDHIEERELLTEEQLEQVTIQDVLDILNEREG